MGFAEELRAAFLARRPPTVISNAINLIARKDSERILFGFFYLVRNELNTKVSKFFL